MLLTRPHLPRSCYWELFYTRLWFCIKTQVWQGYKIQKTVWGSCEISCVFAVFPLKPLKWLKPKYLNYPYFTIKQTLGGVQTIHFCTKTLFFLSSCCLSLIIPRPLRFLLCLSEETRGLYQHFCRTFDIHVHFDDPSHLVLLEQYRNLTLFWHYSIVTLTSVKDVMVFEQFFIIENEYNKYHTETTCSECYNNYTHMK